MRPNNPVLIAGKNATVQQLSAAVSTPFMVYGSAMAIFTANDAAGAITFEASNDPYEQLPGAEAPQHWVTVPSTSQTVTSGGTVLIPATLLCYRWVRINWAPSGGSAGTVTVNANFIGGN